MEEKRPCGTERNSVSYKHEYSVHSSAIVQIKDKSHLRLEYELD